MSLTDYSQFEEEIKNAPELQILPAKSEVKLRIIKVDHKVIEKEDSDYYGWEFLNILFDIPEYPLASVFTHFMWDLSMKDRMDPGQWAKATRAFRDFAQAFGLDYSRPFSWDADVPGLEGWAVLKIVKDKGGEYPDKNDIQKFIVPK